MTEPAAASCPPPLPDSLRCWVLSDGAAGAESQCLGLTEALGVDPVIKRLEVRAPWRWLPPELWANPIAALSGEGDVLAPPWPDLVIASGRKTAAPALAVRRASQGGARQRRAFLVQVQDPRMSLDDFDLVVAPRHDGLFGDNVVATTGALTRITPARLADGRAAVAAQVDTLPSPRVAVLVGGRSRGFDVRAPHGRRMGQDLADLCARSGGSLLVTFSRRTPPAVAAALSEALSGVPAWVYRPGVDSGPNPYFGFLARADHIVVTTESVTMASEAASTGTPVHLYPLGSGGRPKFARFHKELTDLGIARPFDGTLPVWSYAPLAESRRVAALLAQRLQAAGPVTQS